MDNETKMMFELIIDKIDKMDSHFGTIDRRLDAIDKRLDAMDERFDGIDRRLDAMDEQFNVINGRLDRLESTVGHIKARQDRDSRKLTDLQLQIQVFERDVKRNFARVNDVIDTIVEILKLNGLIPQ
jgi:predicted  nucleic acid-binding Zn-ribbon protein